MVIVSAAAVIAGLGCLTLCSGGFLDFGLGLSFELSLCFGLLLGLALVLSFALKVSQKIYAERDVKTLLPKSIIIAAVPEFK